MTRSSWRSLLGAAPALLVLVMLFGGGLLQAAMTSLEGGGAAWGRVLENPDFWPALWLTLRVSVLSTIFSVVLAVCVALVLRDMAQTRLGRVSRALVQIPLPMPHLVIALAMLMLLSPRGLLGRVLAMLSLGTLDDPLLPTLVHDPWGMGVVLTYVWKETPFLLVLLLSSLRGETRRLEEAARNLGASAWRTFWTVTLPAMGPALRLGGLLVFAYAFGAFEVPLILGRTRPTMLGVLSWQLYTDVDLGRRPEAMAVAMMILGAALVLGALVASVRLIRDRRAG